MSSAISFLDRTARTRIAGVFAAMTRIQHDGFDAGNGRHFGGGLSGDGRFRGSRELRRGRRQIQRGSRFGQRGRLFGGQFAYFDATGRRGGRCLDGRRGSRRLDGRGHGRCFGAAFRIRLGAVQRQSESLLEKGLDIARGEQHIAIQGRYRIKDRELVERRIDGGVADAHGRAVTQKVYLDAGWGRPGRRRPGIRPAATATRKVPHAPRLTRLRPGVAVHSLHLGNIRSLPRRRARRTAAARRKAPPG